MKEDSYVIRKYKEFIEKNGYMPNMFNTYNCKECNKFSNSFNKGGKYEYE